ncbi:transcription activator of gluconeogenesis [Corynespora cassiicola Philippines]|uniref:Transcription activator of gluconeogenesis n=1 Tax=Corynespora cassiicola Philippines TaxID=1448308 RepID=A0A2T2PDB1_CORCC|nr:transcription activator of gluconeogenesis [Corynespora cassiicola Philippines]
MTTPDADDASPSPEYGRDPDGSDMAAEQKTDHASGASSPAQKPNPSKASNAKDPLRPRRKKARRACFACQRAHLTCGDERPCGRCIKRGLQDQCMDGVRKKAKYLHDAPDGALMPGVGGHYPHPGHINGNHAQALPGQNPPPMPAAPQASFFSQPPSSTAYYAQNTAPVQTVTTPQDAPGAFNSQQTPISPPYSQTNQASIASAQNAVPQAHAQPIPQQQQQFGGPLFDPSDPALFNFDISSLNFGNHYGALEMGILGHMSAGATENPPNDSNLMNPLNQAANIYNPHMSSGAYHDNTGAPVSMTFGPHSLPGSEWQQNSSSRHGSVQMQTPNNTPITNTIDHHGERHDSINGPHAFAIGQGPSSVSSASPASTDVNSGYDNDNPLSAATFFANANQRQSQRSPTTGRLPYAAPQPAPSNVVRKRRRETKWIYEEIVKPYDYVASYHRLFELIRKRSTRPIEQQFNASFRKFRPVLLQSASEMDDPDLIHAERNLQRTLISLEERCGDLGVPALFCRRSGEVVGMNKEFTILTGWKREVLLGQESNLNVNLGISKDPTNDSGVSTRTSTTPNMPGQEPDNGPKPVNILELMDERSAAEYFEDFADLAHLDPMGYRHRRVNFLQYRTQEDAARIEEMKARAVANGKHIKPEPMIKLEGGPVHQGEAAISNLGTKDGMVDCMIWWHIKRDNLDLPMLVVMAIMPVLKGAP